MSDIPAAKCGTGVPGLDDICGGGLPRACLYLVEGTPGVGKTTFALQFLLEGLRRGERCLYVTLSETRRELDTVASSHGWTLGGMDLIELSEVERALAGKSKTTLFQASELELEELTRLLMARIEERKPQRVVIDSLSELRLLTQSALRFRRQVLSLKHRLAEAGCTVLMLDDRSDGEGDSHIHSIVHGAFLLTAARLGYGVFRRYLALTKLRATRFREGNHDYIIRRGGLQVFARLVASEHVSHGKKRTGSSGNPELDRLLGGGLHYGTSTLLIGPAGSGKSTVAMMYAHAAAARGEHVRYYMFDETVSTLLSRARELGIDFAPLMESGRIALEQIDPAEIAPGELAWRIRCSVEEQKTCMVVLDSLNGYVNAMPQEDFLHLHLHELATYLNQQGVMTLMILAQSGLIGPMGTPIDISYLADAVMVFRYFEALGEVKKAVSVIKKRSGPHENTVREIRMTAKGVAVSEPLTEFQGVLTGVPQIVGGTRRT
ncbi:MAG TPA: ATPase domain-containing protein [Burkholderiales bacterium]|nr:ATPase domain-containing protein [Burkholderiales bacterium]